jgi:hypothetical protein
MPTRIILEIMKSSLFIASNREEVARDAPWAKIIEPLPELKDGWLACDTREAYDYAYANRAKFLPTPREGRNKS